MKKILSIALVLVLLAGIAVSGTMAYLTDTDSDVNVMTLGNVDIEQHEYQRAENADGTFKTDTIDDQTSYVLEDFEQAKALLPIVGDPSTGAAGWDATIVRMTQVDSYGSMDVFAGKNAQDKFVTVENTGKSDAYVRTLVAIEVGDAAADLIGTSYHKTWTKNDVGTVEIDGVNYFVCEYVYAGGQLSDGSWRHENGVLPAKDTTYPNLSQVYLKSVATNEDMVAIDGNGNGMLDILVLSQAVQTAGFETAAEALEAAFPKGENNANVAEWFEGVIEDNADAPVDTWDGTADTTSWYNANDAELTLSTAEAVAGLAELVNGGNTFEGKTIKLDADLDLKGENWTPIGSKEEGKYFTGTFDGNGHTVSGLKIESGDYVAFIGAAKDATIKNVTVEGIVSGEDAAGVVARVEGSTTVENCVNNADVTSSSGKAGGIACNATNTGEGIAEFINCVNNGDITGAANAGLGGILGYANTDAVVEMTNCKNNGDITATNDTVQYVGAAIGYAAAGSKGEISGFENSGALNGGNSLGDSLNRYLVQDNTVLAAYCGTPANWTVS